MAPRAPTLAYLTLEACFGSAFASKWVTHPSASRSEAASGAFIGAAPGRLRIEDSYAAVALNRGEWRRP